MTEESTHQAPADVDPAQAGATIGGGLVPDEAVEGEAMEASLGRADTPGGEEPADTSTTE